jgi:hypothetical protein
MESLYILEYKGEIGYLYTGAALAAAGSGGLDNNFCMSLGSRIPFKLGRAILSITASATVSTLRAGVVIIVPKGRLATSREQGPVTVLRTSIMPANGRVAGLALLYIKPNVDFYQRMNHFE